MRPCVIVRIPSHIQSAHRHVQRRVSIQAYTLTSSSCAHKVSRVRDSCILVRIHIYTRTNVHAPRAHAHAHTHMHTPSFFLTHTHTHLECWSKHQWTPWFALFSPIRHPYSSFQHIVDRTNCLLQFFEDLFYIYLLYCERATHNKSVT